MPVPLPLPTPLPDPPVVTPFHLAKPQHWAETQVATSHLEAIYAFGEYVMFVLMWGARDFEAGRVARCSTCYVAAGRSAVAYNQPDRHMCPDCFGTSFQGGYRARIVRPALITDRTTDTISTPRGPLATDQVTVETVPGFSLHHGDYLLRWGGMRYQCEEGSGIVVRSGFDFPAVEASVAAVVTSARLEDAKSVAYLLPPDRTTLDAVLRSAIIDAANLPPDMTALELIRGALIV